MAQADDRLILRDLHGELSPDEAQALVRRRRHEATLDRRYRELKALWADLDSAQPEAAPSGLAQDVMSTIRAERSEGFPTWLTAPTWFRFSGALALGLGLALGYQVSPRQTLPSDVAILVESYPGGLAESYWLLLDPEVELVEIEGSLFPEGDGR